MNCRGAGHCGQIKDLFFHYIKQIPELTREHRLSNMSFRLDRGRDVQVTGGRKKLHTVFAAHRAEGQFRFFCFYISTKCCQQKNPFFLAGRVNIFFGWESYQNERVNLA